MRKTTVSVVLAILMLVVGFGATPAYAAGVHCSNADLSFSYDATTFNVSWVGNSRVTGAWLVVPNGIAGRSTALGIPYFFIPVSGAGSRAFPGDATLVHSGSGSTVDLPEGGYTHSYLLVRTTQGFCKTPLPNFSVDFLPKQ
ncbi:MAG: hypothetical protein M1347_08000 [Chloroflexi bacterium]|nr:hypothetical protein [Chloroflexota bacterium]